MNKTPPRRGRTKGSKNGDGAAQPKPFIIVYHPSSGGKLKVHIGDRPYPDYADEISLLAPAIITPCFGIGGLRIAGNGVVRKDGRTIRVTA